MFGRSLVMLALAACGTRNSEPIATTGSAPKVAADAAIDANTPTYVVTAPHSGQIAVVAVADTGDVAISAGENGELRFWPRLDGTREPVVIRGHAPVELALAREHDGHVAALLDAANGVELLHIASDGAVRSRQVMSAEPGVEELAASATALLARRTDHTIARLDARATRTLAPEMGQQVLAIAARGSAAIAGIADHERPSEINVVREIRLSGDLAWGHAYDLPVPLAAPIAVSPSGRHLAGLHARTGVGVMIELVPMPRVVVTQPVGTDVSDNTIGFLDDERAVFRSGSILGVPQVAAAADPWAGTPSTRVRLGRNSVVADAVVVGGLGTHLVIASPGRTQFLGYRDLGVGFLRVTGPQITLAFGRRVLWLDDKLASVRADEVVNDATGGIAVDDRHLLKGTYTYLDGHLSRLDVALLDVVTDKELPLGSWSQGATLAYDHHTKVFAVAGYTTQVARLRLDLATGKATPLRPLQSRGDTTVALLDPTLADGAVAVTHEIDRHGMRIDTFVDDGKSNRPLPATSSVHLADTEAVLGVDQTGTIYTLVSRPASQPKPIFLHKAGNEVKRLMVDGAAAAGAVDRAGTMIAVYSAANVVLYDMDGKERWRVPAWSVNIATFTSDGKTLLVNTQGGLMALDTATGERRATGCGWGFGLSAVEPPLTVFMAPVVCAEGS